MNHEIYEKLVISVLQTLSMTFKKDCLEDPEVIDEVITAFQNYKYAMEENGDMEPGFNPKPIEDVEEEKEEVPTYSEKEIDIAQRILHNKYSSFMKADRAANFLIDAYQNGKL